MTMKTKKKAQSRQSCGNGAAVAGVISHEVGKDRK